MPPLLGDIVVQLLAEEFTIQVVGSSGPGEDALRDARSSGADLLIVRKGVGGSTAALFGQGRLHVLAIEDDGRTAALVPLVQERLMLDRDNLRSIISALSGAVAGHA